MRLDVVALFFLCVPLAPHTIDIVAQNLFDIRMNYHQFEREKIMRRLTIEKDECHVRASERGQEVFFNETVVMGKLFTVIEEEIENIFGGDEKHIVKYIFVTIVVGF